MVAIRILIVYLISTICSYSYTSYLPNFQIFLKAIASQPLVLFFRRYDVPILQVNATVHSTYQLNEQHYKYNLQYAAVLYKKSPLCTYFIEVASQYKTLICNQKYIAAHLIW